MAALPLLRACLSPSALAIAICSFLAVIVQIYIRSRQPPLLPAVTHPVCSSSFHVQIRGFDDSTADQWPCFVPPPPRYEAPLPKPHSLWTVPRASLGELNTSDPKYRLHVILQRWAHVNSDYINIRTVGGTSGRAFKDNFDYVQTLLSATKRHPRCGAERAPVMLDMGGGIGSVAAALVDERGGSHAIRTIAYVWPDEYLRLQAIGSHRRLPVYLANFTGHVPFPSHSLDYVHCKWCWHHVVGYDLWLDEVSRVLVPGGYFIFTLSHGDDGILKHPQWDEALARQPFTCRRTRRIMLICRKHVESQQTGVHVDNDDFCPIIMQTSLERSMRRLRRSWKAVVTQKTAALIAIERVGGSSATFSRVLNLNCPDIALCASLETPALSTDVVHINSEEGANITSGLLSLRKLAMTHDWSWNIPVYPRSFDLVNVGCTADTLTLMDRVEFWLDVHRVLRPGGMAIVLRTFCDWDFVKGKAFLKRNGYGVALSRKHVLVVRRIEVAKQILERNLG